MFSLKGKKKDIQKCIYSKIHSYVPRALTETVPISVPLSPLPQHMPPAESSQHPVPPAPLWVPPPSPPPFSHSLKIQIIAQLGFLKCHISPPFTKDSVSFPLHLEWTPPSLLRAIQFSPRCFSWRVPCVHPVLSLNVAILERPSFLSTTAINKTSPCCVFPPFVTVIIWHSCLLSNTNWQSGRLC